MLIRTYSLLLVFLSILYIFTSCSSNIVQESTPLPIESQIIFEKFDSFSLPEGYTFADRSVNTLPLLK